MILLKYKTIIYFSFIAVLLVSYIVIFIGLVEELRENELDRFDNTIIQFIQGLISDKLTSFMKFLTFFGSIRWLGSAVIVASLILAVLHKKRYAIFLIVSSGLGSIFNIVLKSIFRRERPDILPIIIEHGFSFPSGHSMGSFILYGSLAIVLVKVSRRLYLDWICVGLCVVAILLIGISRIYLGVHYPSDVIAGFAAGGAWLTICGLGLRYAEYTLAKKSHKRREL
ncbi:phosphatase PAP2 family protein [Peribacillus cavernae]|uniref:Phosphatase PAP2 family protein n=1 Tax=Peribacillus cavernae TaxID=1674310 RepID=A0A433HW93_9BACI|nr:phosphatase PAP2 family protein [Peribacillus cavernae]MDQ0217882.1 undecaprenyl-diphosphatase [Peribacillus cavernae]RUQ32545.1 phosphatase PAP2 family protein [Peribacillus cavernae]